MKNNKIEIIFLGTNGWYDTKTGNTISILIKTNSYNIVLDAGYGLSKLENFYNSDNPTFLFISHLHLDHIIGLHTLAKFNFKFPLTIFSHENFKEDINKIINSPFTVPLASLRYKTKLLEMPLNKNELPFKVEFAKMNHSVITLGISLELDNKIITYCSDTGYCKEAVELSKNSDILITECALKSGEVNEKWPHLNPETAARIAKESCSKKLILTHFDAGNYPSLISRKKALYFAKKIFKNTIISEDGLSVIL